MGGLFGSLFSPSPQTSTSTTNQTSTTGPASPYYTQVWNNLTGTAAGLASYPINNYYSGQLVAQPSDLSNQYWNEAGAYGQVNPTIQPAQGTLQQMSGAAYNLQQPNTGINLPSFNTGSFAPDQGTLNGIAAWGNQLFSQTPQVQAAPGVSGNASSYLVNPQQVSAPGGVGMIGGLSSVQAPQLQQYQMGPAQQTSTQSFTAPGVAQQFMSPYTQQVVNAQLAQAQVQEQQQLAQQNAAATAAGAFGGSRQAVENANTSIGYQQLAAQIQAQGLQNAFQNAQQQFNTQQGLGLQSQMANQQAGLTVGGQNLAAQLQTQGLGAQLGMQGQLANQQAGLQSALANQQAQEFGAGQNLQSQLANQQAGIQTGLAAQQMGLQGGMFNAQQQNQMSLANQAALMQGLGMQYQGGLQGALQQQQLGLQGQIAGGQLGLQSAAQQQQLQQAQQAQNLQDIMNAGSLQMNQANLGLAGYQAGLQGQQALANAAQSEQGYQQSVNDAQLAQWMMNWQLPMQALGYEAGIQSMMNPMIPMTTTQQGTTTGTIYPAQASIFSQLLGGAVAALPTINKIMTGAKGGLSPQGLGSVKFRDSNYRSQGRYRKGGLDSARRYQAGGAASNAAPAAKSNFPAAPPWMTTGGSGPTLASLADPNGARLALAQKLGPAAGSYFEGLENQYGPMTFDPTMMAQRGQSPALTLTSSGGTKMIPGLPPGAQNYWQGLMSRFLPGTPGAASNA
jgi:hypothetical protein